MEVPGESYRKQAATESREIFIWFKGQINYSPSCFCFPGGRTTGCLVKAGEVVQRKGQEGRARQRGVLQQEWQKQGQVLPFIHQDREHAMSVYVTGQSLHVVGSLKWRSVLEKASTHMCAHVRMLVPEWWEHTPTWPAGTLVPRDERCICSATWVRLRSASLW